MTAMPDEPAPVQAHAAIDSRPLAARLARVLVRALFGQQGERWLPPLAARALPGIGAVLAASLAAAMLGLSLPLLTKQVIDQGIMGRDMGALLIWSGMAFALGLASVGLGMGNALLHLRASARMLADLRGTLLAAALARDPALPDLPLGETMSRLDGDSATIQSFVFDSLLVAAGAVFRLAGGLALMVALDWRLAALPALLAPLELWFLRRARPRTRSLAEVTRRQRGDLAAQLTETLSTAQTLRALGATDPRQADFADMQTAQISHLTRQRLWAETVGAVTQVMGALSRSVVLLVGGWLVIRGDWPIGTLIAYLAYAGMMSGPLRNLLGLYHAQAGAVVALSRLDTIMQGARPDHGHPATRTGATVHLLGARAVGGSHSPVTATIPPGAHVLVDGPSGIGKSRLMAALSGAAPLAEGELRLGDQPIQHLRPADLPRHILHLAQGHAVLRGSVAQNLRLARPDADSAAMWAALRVADLADWVRAAGGLDAPLTETGANLSGGLRQKIALARAVLHPAPVVILDETLSEIDAASAGRILTGLRQAMAGRTCLFIAHAGPVRDQTFDQRITLSSIAPSRRNSRGLTPYQRAKARENAV